MDLTIWSDGTSEQEARVSLQISNEGDVTWNLEKDWTQNVVGNHTTAVGGDYSVEVEGAASVTSQGDATVESSANLSLAAGANADVTAGSVATVEAPMIKLGDGASSQAVKGTELFNALTAFTGAGATACGAAPLSPLAGVFSDLAADLATILSAKVKVE
jgi:hypothetical protein